MGFLLSPTVLAACLALMVVGHEVTDEKFSEYWNEATVGVDEENRKTSPLTEDQGDADQRQAVQQILTPRAFEMDQIQKLLEELSRVIVKEEYIPEDQVEEVLSAYQLEDYVPDVVSQCKYLTSESCDGISQTYRTIDGSCNNPENPTWGMASTCFKLFTEAHYSDGISEFRRATSGSTLPNPRSISQYIHTDVNNPSEHSPHMLMMVGQFAAHDISWTPASVDGMKNPIDCCSDSGKSMRQCAAIWIPEDDEFFSEQNVNCLNFVRAARCATCKLGPRSHTNQVSSFLDLSHVYGWDYNVAEKNRVKQGGLLKYSQHEGITLLPRSDKPDRDACSYQLPGLHCFSAGDERVNQHPALTSMHTVFMRYHNFVASALQDINPHWNDERLYQEARRILIAEWQRVIYYEFLPLFVGRTTMEKHLLRPQLEESYTAYDPSVNPTMSPEFAVAAYRAGHSTIDAKFALVFEEEEEYTKDTKDEFFNMEVLYKKYGAESYISGLAKSQSQQFDEWVTHGVTRYLYQETKGHHGLDLASINIQRGRDTGLPPYVRMVEFCDGQKIETFEDLRGRVKEELIEKLRNTYESVHDIDLFTGGLCEEKVHDGALGPTFACIVAEQFWRTQVGDWFYFEHGGLPSSFSEAQLKEIRSRRLVHILCEGSSARKLQPDVLLYESESNEAIDCSEFRPFDWSLWKDVVATPGGVW